MHLTPVTLEGRLVRLEPLTLDHLPGLCACGLDGRLWEWTLTSIRSEADMRAYVETALAWQRAGTALPFATVSIASGQVIGCTRYANVDRDNRRVEIGWTWIAEGHQRTGSNVEAKYLMLRHAFEQLACIRVEFKTDSLNAKSRAALLGIGAIEEGTLRNHMIVQNGRLRHSVYFSITQEEWPTVRDRLLARLSR